MHSFSLLPATAAFSLVLTTHTVAGDKAISSTAPEPAAPSVNFLTGEGVSLGGVLFPHLHVNAAYGKLGAEGLEAGHHDPAMDGWNLQSIEPGLSFQAGKYVEGFTTYALSYDREESKWDGEFEEYFLGLKNLPGGFSLRGGLFLNRFGLHNARHLHAWEFIDNNLVNGRFLGDDGLATTGGEITWTIPVSWASAVSFSAGDARTEDEPHEEEEGAEEPLYEAEGAAFAGTLYNVNWTNQWNTDDFHSYRAGLSGAWGDNVWGRTSYVLGLHAEYEWRQNGMERGGRYLRWRTEAMTRRADVMSGHLPGEEPEEEEAGEDELPVAGQLSEWGLNSAVTYGMPTRFAGPLEASLRADYVSGIAEANLEERFRLSPSLRLYISEARTAFVGAQYNWDRRSGENDAHSCWVSMGFNWGGKEVR